MGKYLKKMQELKEKFRLMNSQSVKSVLQLVQFLKEHALNEKYKRSFDQSVDMIFNLNLKGKYSIKDSVILPYVKLKKNIKILVLAKGEKLEEASSAGADHVGSIDYIDKIKSGWLDFDLVLATPDIMKDVSRVAQVLGKRGLMPNPKVGTIGFDIKSMVEGFRKGKKIYQADKKGVLSLSVGYLSMEDDKLVENMKYMYAEILSKRPVDLKGVYIRSMYMSATMTPSLDLVF